MWRAGPDVDCQEEVGKERKPSGRERNSSTIVQRMGVFTEALSFPGKAVMKKDALNQLGLVLPV